MRPSTTDDRTAGSLTGVARAVVVVAAGSGTRLGLGTPKAFVEVGGRSILARSLDAVLASAVPTQVVVVVPQELVAEATALVEQAAGHVADHATVVVGGATRQASVAAGLEALAPDVATVLVHDGARPFTPTAQFELVASTVEATGLGVVPGLPVTDSIKRVDDERVVVGTVDRAELVAMQTPQGFPREALVTAFAEARAEHTDDAALFAAAGHEVVVVDGDPVAFKITTRWDLQRAETIAAGRAAAEPADPGASPATAADPRLRPATSLRTGLGVDVHAYDAAQPMRLGLLDFADEPGLAGHSDGDAVAHAVVDALLSAAGLGDIGTMFGTDDPRFAGASGEVFLAAAVERLTHAGVDVVNVAVQVVGDRPRLSARRLEMEARLIEVVGAPVSVSATTTDGLGFTGRREGLQAIATALVSVLEPGERTASPASLRPATTSPDRRSSLGAASSDVAATTTE